MVTDVFIKRPILATVCSILITLAGAIAIPTLPIGRYPELAPPTVAVSAFYTGANAQAVESAVTTPLESVINGVEGMVYMTSAVDQQRVLHHHGDVRSRARSRSRGSRRAEPRQLCARTHAARGAHKRHQRHEGLRGLSRRHRLLLRQQPVQLALHQQLPRPLRARRISSACLAWPTSSSSASGALRCVCGSIRTASPDVA